MSRAPRPRANRLPPRQIRPTGCGPMLAADGFISAIARRRSRAHATLSPCLLDAGNAISNHWVFPRGALGRAEIPLPRGNPSNLIRIVPA